MVSRIRLYLLSNVSVAESERETKRQNKEIERSYRELVSDIENVLRSITDFFIDVAQDGDIEDAFRDLGKRLGTSVLEELESSVAGKIAGIISPEGAALTSGGGGGGIGGALAGGITSLGAALLPSDPNPYRYFSHSIAHLWYCREDTDT